MYGILVASSRKKTTNVGEQYTRTLEKQNGFKPNVYHHKHSKNKNIPHLVVTYYI